MDAHYEVSRKIRQAAQSAMARDLGIIASGQLALRYWIAAFGTIRTYAAKLGMVGVQGSMQACLDEGRQADEHHTELARRIMGGGA